VTKDTGELWVSVREAAELVGRSESWVRGEVRSGALVGCRGQGRRWLIRRADLMRALTSPAPVPLSAPSGRYVSADRRSHAELLDATGLSDEAVAEFLGVATSRVHRWHMHGVPNLYVARLRALVAEDGGVWVG
jgi:excisionase family DNA binding protein